MLSRVFARLDSKNPLPLTEKEQEYINKYILGHEEEWDFENLKVECYYSFFGIFNFYLALVLYDILLKWH